MAHSDDPGEHQRLLGLRACGPASRGPACPPAGVWTELAAGVTGPAEAAGLVEHAATCDHCGGLLRAEAELLSSTVTAEEELAIAALHTSQPDGRRALARRMHRAARPHASMRRWALAAAVLVAIAAWPLTRLWLRTSPERLALAAYTGSRSLELRFPGAAYGPVKQQRAARDQHSVALLEAEAAITRRMNERSPSASLLEAKARIDLLEWQYESAIQELRRALVLEPDSPALLTDLASAHFERAEAESKTPDYGVAIDLLGKAIAGNAGAAALFNRAIVYERMGLVHQAIADWRQYLARYGQDAWAAEARERLDTLLKKKTSRDAAFRRLVTRPEDFLQLPAADIDARVEEYLQTAVTSWLVGGNAPARASAARLGALLRQGHGDPWLADLAAGPPSARNGIAALSRAVALNAQGKHPEAERSARQAAADPSAPNRLRAGVEIVYALNRQVRGPECVAAADRLAADLRRTSYRWLLAQLLLDRSTCRKITGDFAGARQDIDEASAIAESARFGVLQLRALGFAASLDRSLGNAAGAWSKDRRGLLLYWTGAYPPLRAHQFCSDLGFWARKSRRWHLAAALAREAVAAIAGTPNEPGEALARYRLASAAALAGFRQEAESEFARAASLFDRMPRDQMTQTYQTYSELGLASLESQRGDFAAPLAAIARLRPRMDASAHILRALSFHITAGTLSLRRGEHARAEQDFQTALGLGQRALASIRDDADRQRWQSEMAELYRGLVRIRLDRRDHRGALDRWMEFRGAALDRLGRLNGHSLLVYAQLPDGVAAWLADDRGLAYHWIPVRAEDLEAAVEQFAALCADPGAGAALLRAPAQRLYGWLVAPFAHRLEPVRPLIVSADAVIGRVPFHAIVDERFAVAVMPGDMTAGPPARFTRDAGALIVAAPALRGGAAATFPPLPDAAREGSSIAARFAHPLLLTGPAAVPSALLPRLPEAEIFHFAGHALTAAAEPGLVLAASDGDTPQILSGASLGSGTLRRCRLAVLSACQTAWGESDAAIDPDDLVRALLRAGAAHVIASRWRVDSRATATYMDGFYRSLLSGRALPLALRDAAAALRRNPATNHPYYWAAFDLYSRELP